MKEYNANDNRKKRKKICLQLMIFAAAVLIISHTALSNQYTFLGNYQSHQPGENSLTIQTENNVIKFTVINGAVVRIQVGKEDQILDTPSYTVDSAATEKTQWSLRDEDQQLILTLPEGYVIVKKFPVRLQFLDMRGNELDADDASFGHSWDGKEVRVFRKLNEDAKFFGLGEKTGALDKRGKHWTMWNTDFYAYDNSSDPLYLCIPFLIGLHDGCAYGIFFDNTYRATFNLGAGNNRLYSFGAEDGEMNYYFIFGPDMRDVLSRYARLTGKMPLPPKWALGYQQCRWSYFPEYEVMDLAKNFRQRKIPADVIYLDIHYMDQYKVFTWNKERFPDPETMLAELQLMGFKVITIIDPGVKVEQGYFVHDEGVKGSHFLTYPDGKLFQGAVWPGWCYFPDFSKATTRDWWGKYYYEMKNQGVSGFWNDMNEPAVRGDEFPYLVLFDDEGQRSTIKKMHNVYAYLEAKATYEGLKKHSPNERPFILSRSGWAGIQKYAAKWTGDNVADFDNLRMSVLMSLGLGLSGVPFVGPDIGGFVGSPTPELFARWVELGVFTPFFRNHTSHSTRDQEPWCFGEPIEQIARGYISLRYQLMPYIYTEFRKASETGVPAMRPVFLNYQNDKEAYSKNYQYQFLFGDNILVAPVVEENQHFKKVYLPEGRWLDKWTEKVHEGNSEIIVDAPLEKLPAFFRVGGFIPNRKKMLFVDEFSLSELIVDVIAGDFGQYELYLDDGKSYDYEKGDFDEIKFRQFYEKSSMIILSQSTNNKWAAGIQSILYKIHNIDKAPVSVKLGKEKIAHEYSSETKVCEIKVPFQTGEQALTLKFK